VSATTTYLDEIEEFVDTCLKRSLVCWTRKWIKGTHNENDEDNAGKENDSAICILSLAASLVEDEPLLVPEDFDWTRLRILSDILGYCDLNLPSSVCQICEQVDAPEPRSSVRTRQAKETKTCVKCGKFTHMLCSRVPKHIMLQPKYVFVCQEK
jgi:hypothetical protein